MHTKIKTQVLALVIHAWVGLFQLCSMFFARVFYAHYGGKYRVLILRIDKTARKAAARACTRWLQVHCQRVDAVLGGRDQVQHQARGGNRIYGLKVYSVGRTRRVGMPDQRLSIGSYMTDLIAHSGFRSKPVELRSHSKISKCIE